MSSNSLLRNPYIAGKALGDERGFFGRDDVFQLVTSVLSSPDQNAVVLFGQRRIGKTSILLQLRRHLPSPPFHPFYFDLMDCARKPLGVVLYELAATISTELNLAQPTNADFTVMGSQFRDVFLPALYQKIGTDVRPVFLFDEFDVLDVAAAEELPRTAAARAFVPYMRRLMESEPRLAFVFVVGRKAEDLSIDVKATFKAAHYKRISVLDEEGARKLVGLAERNGSLRFTPAASDHLLSLTARHPYFTQLMCQLLFDRAYAKAPSAAPTIDVDEVTAIVPKALEAGENIFEWIWDGLPPAERVIFSAIAGATSEQNVIAEDELLSILQRHGIRILIRELELAPKTLIDWEMLRRIDGGYGFFIELMRRWVAERKPLPKVKDELDRVNPIADQQYHLGYTYYRLGNLQDAVAPLQAALQVNPNHLKARLLLGETLREQGELDEAVKQLEEAYRYDEDAARYPLVRALLAQAEAMEQAEPEDAALKTYQRVLEISPRESVALERRRAIFMALGDRAVQADNLDEAVAAYREAGVQAKVAEVLAMRRKRTLETSAKEIDILLQHEEWDKAAEVYRRLIEVDPDDKRWSDGLARVEQERNTARRYAEGLGAMQQSKWTDAQRALADVVYARPDYKDAASQLATATQKARVLKEEAERFAAKKAEEERMARADAAVERSAQENVAQEQAAQPITTLTASKPQSLWQSAWVTWLLWTLASGAGTFVVGQIPQFVASDLVYVSVWLSAVFLIGVTTGIAQGVVLRLRIRRTILWILTSIGGWILGSLSMAFMLGLLGLSTSVKLGIVGKSVEAHGNEFIILFVSQLIAGAVVGVLQSLALRRDSTRAAWWIPVSAVCWGITLSVSLQLLLTFNILLVGGTVVGLIYGALSGVALAWVLQARKTRAQAS